MRDLEFNINAKHRTGSAFASAEARAKSFNGELSRTVSGYELAASAAKAFAAGFTITSIVGFAQMVRGVIGDAADLVGLADKVGVSTDNIQRLQFGFKLAGIEASEVDGILTQWSRRLGEAYTQGGRLADILKANGVSLTDGNGKLRSSVDLMRDYAELVMRAGNDSERLKLVDFGFGKANSEMVLFLSNGRAGVDKLMGKAEEVGPLFSNEMLRRQAEIDDAFDELWENYARYAKRGILAGSASMADFLSDVRRAAGAVDDFISAPMKAKPAVSPEIAEAVKGGRLPSGILQDRFDTLPGEVQDNDALIRMMIDRYAPKTIIPNDADTTFRKASAAAATEQASAYENVLQKLREERDLIGLSATQQAILNEQSRAGVTAASAEGRAIAELVTDMERQREAAKGLAETTDFLK